MISNIQIEGFRGIEQLNLPKLGNINVFIGENNSNKTSVLEGIALAVNNFAPALGKFLLEQREEYTSHPQSGKLIYQPQRFFNQKQASNKIQFSYTELGQLAESNTVAYTDLNNLYNENRSEIIPKNLEIYDKEKLAVTQFVGSGQQKFTDNAELWENIFFSNEEDYLIQALQAVAPEVERFAYVAVDNHHTFGKVKLQGFSKPWPIKSMGDGINRALDIILAILNAENGYVFIDEFENGLYHRTQQQLWRLICKLSVQYNTQVFISTHSEDCLRNLARAVVKPQSQSEGDEAESIQWDFEQDLYVYALRKVGEQLKAARFDKEELVSAAQSGLDLRY